MSNLKVPLSSSNYLDPTKNESNKPASAANTTTIKKTIGSFFDRSGSAKTVQPTTDPGYTEMKEAAGHARETKFSGSGTLAPSKHESSEIDNRVRHAGLQTPLLGEDATPKGSSFKNVSGNSNTGNYRPPSFDEETGRLTPPQE